jgi:hypothetical protein
MSYPNVPLGTSAWQRRVAQALNHLLNNLSYNTYIAEGLPTAGEQILITQFPVPITLVDLSGWVPAASVSTADATVTLKVAGTTIATVKYEAGQQDAVATIITPDIPANTDFEIIAPTPADATLADFTLTLATQS